MPNLLETTNANLYFDTTTNEVSYGFTVTESSIKLLSQNYISGVGQDSNFSNTRQVGLPWTGGGPVHLLYKLKVNFLI